MYVYVGMPGANAAAHVSQAARKSGLAAFVNDNTLTILNRAVPQRECVCVIGGGGEGGEGSRKEVQEENTTVACQSTEKAHTCVAVR